MIYLEYEICKSKYYKTIENYEKVLSEKEELFNITQPKASSFDKELVNGGALLNTYDEYLIKKEQKRIEQRLTNIKSVLEERKKLLMIKEEELRLSTNIQDLIYKYRYLEKYSVTKICRLVNYERAQVYRVLKKIKKYLR